MPQPTAIPTMGTTYTATPALLAALRAAHAVAETMPTPSNQWNGLAGMLEALVHIASTLPAPGTPEASAHHPGLATLEGVAATLEGLREIFDTSY